MATSQPRRTDKRDRRGYRRKPHNNRGYAPGVFGAQDLGNNNCRRVSEKQQGKGFRVIDSFSRIVRLGEGVSLTGKLSEDAIERTVEALGICADKMRRAGVTHMRCVATEVCRKADNSDDFLDRVRLDCGINLDIITTAEEAALARAALARTALARTAALPGAGVSKQVAEALVLYDLVRSEEHTSELQSLAYIVCRLLLEKKK